MQKTYQPVGRCIYCGAGQYRKDRPSPKLGDEHIVPLSLGGNLILPEASCHDCEKAINKVEAPLTRGLFLPARTKLKFPTRRKKDRPTHLPLDIHAPSGFETQQVLLENYPAMIMTMMFDTPAILWGLPPKDDIITGRVCISKLPDFDENIRRHPQSTVTWKLGVDAVVLGRMLAKIAHAYTVAEIGLDKFKPFLNDVILDRSPHYISQFVGGEIGDIPPPSQNIYEISLQETVRYDGYKLIVVKIRLFAKWEGMPVYLIVSGQML